MPHWIIVNGQQVYIEHDGGDNRAVPFDETLPEVGLTELDHLPAKLTVQNVEEDVMEAVVKAVEKALKHE